MGVRGNFKFTLLDLEGKVVQVKEYKNVVCTALLNMVAARLNAETTYTGIINYLALGTGTNTPAAADTKLQTEIARTTVYDRSRANNVTTLEFYFAPADAIGNLKEVGAFIDGTASADSGQIFDRAAIDVTKTTLNSLIVTLTITVS